MTSTWLRLTFSFLAICGCFSKAGGQSSPDLKMSFLNNFLLKEELVSFQLDSFDRSGVWILQSSTNGKEWDDLVYMNGGRNIVGFGVSVPRRVVLGEGSGRMLFRAAKQEVEDLIYRDYLAGLLRWRETGYEDYSFVVRSSQGMSEYEARYTVVGGEVTEVETISVWPPTFQPPSDLTIESLFERVKSAIDQDAATINADWSSANGYPETGFIDLAEDLSDDEQSWTILEFIPTNPDSIEFLEARQRWRDAGLTNYSFVAETYNQLGILGIRYTVLNGVATTAEVISQPAFPVVDPEPKTMEQFFAEIAGAFENRAADVSVDYEATNGHPARASIDFEAFIADEERYWNIKEFVNLDEPD